MQKKVNKTGGITLPRQLRLDSGIHLGAAVEIASTKDGILISAHKPSCYFCGSPDDVEPYCGKDICRKCAAMIGKGRTS